ncbi:hypothetical protein [Streptomyces sp. CC224E]|uniref:VMAP-C domain-containing protein n=1 Tax=unclassified Streptomyces TaxID=2593676 RepID=UPI0035572053
MLTEGLRRENRDGTARLLALGRSACIPTILSVREYRWLIDLLPVQGVVSLREAAGAALPHATLFDELPEAALRGTSTVLKDDTGRETERFVEALEAYWGDGAHVPEGKPRVPGLLRVVEYVAACCATERATELREWCEAVIDRLGVASEALDERRDDATAWAATRRGGDEPARPRLTVWLQSRDPGHFLCSAWYASGYRDEAERMLVAEEQARPPAELARLLRRELLRATEAAGRTSTATAAVLEILLDDKDLDEPVEEWDGEDPDTGMPCVLGVEYEVVIRCPEMRLRAKDHLHSWHLRWGHLERGDLVRLGHEHTDRRQVYGLVLGEPSAARVVLSCAEQHRAELRGMCVGLGIPVVLWDRNSSAQNEDLNALMLDGPVKALPQRIRTYRAHRLGTPEAAPTAPALIWDDPTRMPPLPYLRDPTGEEQAS